MHVEREGPDPVGAGTAGAARPPEQQTAPDTPTEPAAGGPVSAPPSGAAPGRRGTFKRGRTSRGAAPKGTKTGGAWITAVLAAIVLLFLLVFILRNLGEVHISLLWWTLSLPLGVALLLAAICGALLVAIPGTGRIIQLRRQYRGRR
jgi:uncharacterized integral membrane protein